VTTTPQSTFSHWDYNALASEPKKPLLSKKGSNHRDRAEAGRRLAAQLTDYANRSDILVLALPRGGVPVAFEVARALHAPLDIFLVRKLGVPGHEELAMGAIATGGVRVLSEDVMRYISIPDAAIDAVAAKEQRELGRRDDTPTLPLRHAAGVSGRHRLAVKREEGSDGEV